MSEALEFLIPTELSYMRELRRIVRQGVEQLGGREERVDMLVLALDEIVSNSIEHGNGYRVAGHQLQLNLVVEGADLRLTFIDPDVPREVVDDMATVLKDSRGATPGFDSERGRGFFLLDYSLDDVEIVPAQSGGMAVHGRMTGVFG